MSAAIDGRTRAPRVLWLGRRRYAPMHEIQERVVAARQEDQIGDIVFLLEHEKVVTLGRNAAGANVLFSEEALSRVGVDLHRTGRGGDVTYHGPGQLVCYPIVLLPEDRRDVRKLVRALAEAMILFLRDHHVESGTVDGLIGVWADPARPSEWAGQAWAEHIAKVGAIGVKISRWVTMHGFALNLTTDLKGFDWIVPCGIKEHGVTSLLALTGRSPSVRDAALGLAPILRRALSLPVSEVEDWESVSDAEIFARLSPPEATPTHDVAPQRHENVGS